MKRFIQDALLVLLLVYVGTYVQHKDIPQDGLSERVDRFENDIAQHKIIEKDNANLNNYENENRASKLAKDGSKCVVTCIEKGVIFISTLYDAMIQ